MVNYDRNQNRLTIYRLTSEPVHSETIYGLTSEPVHSETIEGLNSDQVHIELLPGEIFYTNIDQDKEGDEIFNAIPYKSKRKGTYAFDDRGRIQKNMYPVFINKNQTK
jgi:hypothetical protein